MDGVIIVGNLCEMFSSIEVVGSDVDLCLYIWIGLILLGWMIIVGND